MGLTSVSRSGRVRKKPTKLADFESDDLFEMKLKKQKLQQQQQALQKLQEFERREKNKRLSEHIIQQKKVAIVPLAPLKPHFISQNGRYNGKINGNREVEKQADSLRKVNLNSSRVQVQPMEVDEEEHEEDEEDEEDEEEEEEHHGLASNHNNSTLGADDEESEESDEEVDVDTTLNSTNDSMGFQKLVPRVGTSKSLYMSEKFNRKIVIKNGKVINKSKTERKDKGVSSNINFKI